MGQESKNAGELKDLRKRLSSGQLTKEDERTLDTLIVGAIDLQNAIENASERIGDKTVIAKLPFGVDLVK